MKLEGDQADAGLDLDRLLRFIAPPRDNGIDEDGWGKCLRRPVARQTAIGPDLDIATVAGAQGLHEVAGETIGRVHRLDHASVKTPDTGAAGAQPETTIAVL